MNITFKIINPREQYFSSATRPSKALPQVGHSVELCIPGSDRRMYEVVSLLFEEDSVSGKLNPIIYLQEKG